MRIIILLFALLLAIGCKSPPAESVIQPGMIDFISTDAYQVLHLYSQLTGLKLVKDVQVLSVQNDLRVTLTISKPVTKAQAIKLLETALREQAGVVISPLDAQSVSVTYNPALIVAKTKAAGE